MTATNHDGHTVDHDGQSMTATNNVIDGYTLDHESMTASDSRNNIIIDRPVAKQPILRGQRELWRGHNRPTNARPEIIRKNSVLQRITKNE